MMKQYVATNIIPSATVLNTTRNSSPMQLLNVIQYAIQIVVTGTPTGAFKLQMSNDDPSVAVSSGVYTGTHAPVNWTDITSSSINVSAAGSVYWNYGDIGYNWVRVVYTDTSSGASTAIVTVSTFNGKGV